MNLKNAPQKIILSIYSIDKMTGQWDEKLLENYFKFIEDLKTTNCDTGNVKTFIERSDKPLAELRRKNVMQIRNFKECIQDSNVIKGVAIGISPNDMILNKFTRGEITKLIKHIFKILRERGSDGRLSPVAPLSLVLVGEYSPKHRWHYHGIILVKDITVLDKIKKRLQRSLGRVVTEEIVNVPAYVDYMFKQYMCDEHGSFYDWNRKECYLEFIRQ